MIYGEKRKHQLFRINYTINYKSGKFYTKTREIYAYSELGVISTIKWLHGTDDININFVQALGKFSHYEYYPDKHCVYDQ
jgi:hypothetical protein